MEQTKIVKRSQASFEFRFNPVGAYRDWKNWDAPILRGMNDRAENGEGEMSLTIFGLGFVIKYSKDANVKLEQEEPKVIEKIVEKKVEVPVEKIVEKEVVKEVKVQKNPLIEMHDSKKKSATEKLNEEKDNFKNSFNNFLSKDDEKVVEDRLASESKKKSITDKIVGL